MCFFLLFTWFIELICLFRLRIRHKIWPVLAIRCHSTIVTSQGSTSRIFLHVLTSVSCLYSLSSLFFLSSFLNPLLFILTTTCKSTTWWKWIMAKPRGISTPPMAVIKISLHLVQPGWNGTSILRSFLKCQGQKQHDVHTFLARQIGESPSGKIPPVFQHHGSVLNFSCAQPLNQWGWHSCWDAQ